MCDMDELNNWIWQAQMRIANSWIKEETMADGTKVLRLEMPNRYPHLSKAGQSPE